MSRTNEEWTSEQFELKNFNGRRKIAPNNLEIMNELKLPFVTYNSNKNLPCYVYDIVHRHCVNKEGFMTKEYLQNPTCLKSQKWLTQCIHLNQQYYLMNKYMNEEMLNSNMAAPIRSYKDVLQ